MKLPLHHGQVYNQTSLEESLSIHDVAIHKTILLYYLNNIKSVM